MDKIRWDEQHGKALVYFWGAALFYLIAIGVFFATGQHFESRLQLVITMLVLFVVGGLLYHNASKIFGIDKSNPNNVYREAIMRYLLILWYIVIGLSGYFILDSGGSSKILTFSGFFIGLIMLGLMPMKVKVGHNRGQESPKINTARAKRYWRQTLVFITFAIWLIIVFINSLY